MTLNQKLTGVLQGRKIKAIRQSGNDLALECEDGSVVHIKLAEPTSSVLVRDAQNKLEYTD